MSALRTQIVTGSALAAHIGALATLRIRVFREYPYLYDGTEDYERKYLETYTASPDAMAVLAFDGEKIVGASTGVPMAHETGEFKKPFAARGMNSGKIFYCGESVLLPDYRGRGLYRAFFSGREAHARTLGGFEWITFCGVVRDGSDPRAPAGYEPLDNVWRHFGYEPQPDLIAHYPWREVGATETTDHPMMFWIKRL